MAEIYIYRAQRNKRIVCAFTDKDYEGAILKGGRWNSVKIPMVYTSDSISTAGWEIAQKISYDPSLGLDKNLREQIIDKLTKHFSYCRSTLDIRQIINVEEFYGKPLPQDWYIKIQGVAYRPDIQAIGDQWIKSATSLAMRVPCSITRRHASNYLVNPQHPDYPMLLSKREGFWRYDGEALSPDPI
jgi:RES domain-containing protein